MRTTALRALLSLTLAGCASESLRAGDALDAAPPPDVASPRDAASDRSEDATLVPTPDAGSLRDELEREAEEENWALRVTRAIEGWRLLRARGLEPGAGVIIAHPDTGTSDHPELGPHFAIGARSPIASELARDVVDDDRDAAHDFDALNRIPPTHGHGTETASVIVSPLGCPADGSPRPCVTGISPAARLVPLRASDSVVLLSGDRVADAVDAAVADGAHVISISMGGVGEMPRLSAAIERALAAGIIVVSAAGNWTGIVVVAPSSFDGVVCVAGATPELEPWGTSARGPRVDISAPATEVRYARTRRVDGALVYDTSLAQGTSDATAITAGAAALWLTYHGRDALLARYGASGIPRVFRHLVRTVAFQTPPGWPTDGSYGPGILDIVRLLEAPLPDRVP